MAHKNPIKTFFLSMFRIGCIGFGKGSALIPMIQKTVAEEEKLADQESCERAVVVASITPGALPVEITGGIGAGAAGWRGMLAGAVGMALPGVCMTLVLLSMLSVLDENVFRQIQYITVGVTAFICCLLTDYIAGTIEKSRGMGRKEREEGNGFWKESGLILLVFGLTCGKNLYRLLGIDGTPFF